jgi:sirohydrochlorin ferrochelatase
MTAPALIALAHGSRDPRSAATIKALTEQVACLRPDLRVEPAFLDLAEPSFDQTIDRLVAEGHDEIVVVPLLLSEAYHANVDVPAVAEAATKRHAGIRIELTAVLGLESAVFHVLDRRLREALAKNRVRELDGLVLAGAGSSDPVVNASIARAARRWGQRHKLPTIAAFASQAPPAAGEAVRALRADGRRHIAVGLLFLAPGFLTDRVSELAVEAGAVAVAEPLGADQEIAEIILARYAVGAVDLVDLDSLFADA